ncbi:MAG: Hpt domain-containing protein [Burkholderiaceae bacterium]|nr:Hpt domain-containing protein [Roseateles sp.]MBV8470285.1 Hpt domain-containing protein [Burkholderiaceae bacterium]
MRSYRLLVLDAAGRLPLLFGAALPLLHDEYPIECAALNQTRQVLGALAAGRADLLAIASHDDTDEGWRLLNELRQCPNLLGPCRVLLHCTTPRAATPWHWPAEWQRLQQPELHAQALAQLLQRLLTDIAASSLQEPDGVDNLEQALLHNFGGNQALFERFRASALAQLPRDIERIRRAFRRQDLGTVHRLSHDCKSMLALLGYRAASAMAFQLEQAAHRMEHGDASPSGSATADPWHGLHCLWAALEPLLQVMARQGKT